MGGGVAFFDFDADGDQDLLFVNSTDWPGRTAAGKKAPTSALYRNDGSGRFEDVTAGSGLDVSLYGMGVAVGDYDADGRVDVFITALGENRLFRNAGSGKFEDVTARAGVAGERAAWSTAATFLDFDNDGDLDLFVGNYVRWSKEIDFEVNYQLIGIGRAYGPPSNFEGADPYLYRNEGNGSFTDVSAAAGLEVRNPATNRPMAKVLGAMPVDVDADGWTDIVVANDTVQNFLFQNHGNGSFEEIGAMTGVGFDRDGTATGAMGIDAAYYRGDDTLAIAIGNFANEMTSFYVSQGSPLVFTDEAIPEGIGPASRQRLKFGLVFFDYDLDGRLDLLEANGHIEDEINQVQPSQHYEQPPQLFWNCGGECPRTFVEIPAETLGDFSRALVGRGVSRADIDADGDADVVITQLGRAPVLLRNEQQLGRHWLRVKLTQDGPNRDALGARVELTSGGLRQRALITPSRSYLSQVELPATFGLGEATTVDSLRVIWPDGVAQDVEVPRVDTLLTVHRATK